MNSVGKNATGCLLRGERCAGVDAGRGKAPAPTKESEVDRACCVVAGTDKSVCATWRHGYAVP